jgi:hypothetical protein
MLRDEIQKVAETWAKIGRPALIEHFVLRNGRVYEPCGLIGERRAPKACFQNASRFALEHKDCRYVEGYAMSPGIWFPIHHAWIEIDGKAMDNTWRDPLECEYFGVPFDVGVLRDELLRNKVYGLFDNGMINTDLLFRIDPELKRFLEAKAS